jgi:hypothetical protein
LDVVAAVRRDVADQHIAAGLEVDVQVRGSAGSDVLDLVDGLDPGGLLIRSPRPKRTALRLLILGEIGLEDHELVHRWPVVLDIECHLTAAGRALPEVDLEVGESSVNAISSSTAAAQPSTSVTAAAASSQRDRNLFIRIASSRSLVTGFPKSLEWLGIRICAPHEHADALILQKPLERPKAPLVIGSQASARDVDECTLHAILELDIYVVDERSPVWRQDIREGDLQVRAVAPNLVGCHHGSHLLAGASPPQKVVRARAERPGLGGTTGPDL